MAKTSKGLKERLFSLAVIVAVLSICLPTVKGTYFMGFGLTAKCLDEYISIVRPSSSVGFKVMNFMFGILIVAGGYFSRSLMTHGFLVVVAFLSLVMMCVASAAPENKSEEKASNERGDTKAFTEFCFLVFGQFYISWLGFGHMGLLTRRNMTMHTAAVLFIGIGETAALLLGKRFGRNKFWPALSPNKTVEGVCAQLVFSVLVSVTFCQIVRSMGGNIPSHWSMVDFVATGFFAGAMGILGDLFESFIKRSFDLKDMDTLLPGVGGILDRVDGLFFAMPTLFYYCAMRGAFTVAEPMFMPS